MITYKKKALKVKIIFPSGHNNENNYATGLAKGIKEFIEDGEYSRIADIKIFGCSPAETRAVIIYEVEKESN